MRVEHRKLSGNFSEDEDLRLMRSPVEYAMAFMHVENLRDRPCASWTVGSLRLGSQQ